MYLDDFNSCYFSNPKIKEFGLKLHHIFLPYLCIGSINRLALFTILDHFIVHGQRNIAIRGHYRHLSLILAIIEEQAGAELG